MTPDPIRITDLRDPRAADYLNLRDAELIQRDDPFDPDGHRGLFIAEGELVVRRLIASPFRVRSLFLTHARLETMRDAIHALRARPDGIDVPVLVGEQSLMNEVIGFNIHRGVLAAGVRPRAHTLSALLARPGPFLVLEDLYNHDNIGSIFRNAAALAGTGAAVLLTPRTADPLYRKCIRVSVGHVLSIPFTRLTDWPGDAQDAGDLAAFRAAGVRSWALTPSDDALDIADAARAEPNAKVALLLGSEGPGLTEAAISAADQRVRIPMRRSGPHVDSLNVAVAAALALAALPASIN